MTTSLEKHGLVYVFTGEGKGKTSAALGVATRALLLDKKVVWIAFYKQASWGLAEAKLPEKFPNLEMMLGGRGFRISTNNQTPIIKQIQNSKHQSIKTAPVGNGGQVVVDTASEEEHRAAAVACIQHAANSLLQRPFLLVLDEVLNVVSDGLVESEVITELLAARGNTHVVLTGRAGTESARMILAGADLVTECTKVKHPYDEGKLAVAGLDF